MKKSTTGSRNGAVADIVTAQVFLRDAKMQEVAAWIRVGIEHYIRQDGSLDGFRPIEGYFNFDLPISEGVAAVYAELDAATQSKLRNSLARVLDDLPVSIATAPIIKELLYVARRIPAPEIFSCLPKKVKGMSDSKGPFFDTALSDIGGRTLFDVVFQVVVDMPVEGSLSVLNELIGSQHFDESLSGLALDALCRVDAGHFPAHFGKLREPINRMFAAYGTPERMKRLLAKRIVKSIGLEMLGRMHFQLKAEAGLPEETDNWFISCLFEGVDPILKLRGASPDACEIAWADGEAQAWVPLIPPSPDVSRVVQDISPGRPAAPLARPHEPEETTETKRIWALFLRCLGPARSLARPGPAPGVIASASSIGA